MSDDKPTTPDPFSVLQSTPINPELRNRMSGAPLHPSKDDWVPLDETIVSLNTRVKRRLKTKLKRMADKNNMTIQEMVEHLIDRA